MTRNDKTVSNLYGFHIAIKECLERLQEVIGSSLQELALRLAQFLLRLAASDQDATCKRHTVAMLWVSTAVIATGQVHSKYLMWRGKHNTCTQ